MFRKLEYYSHNKSPPYYFMNSHLSSDCIEIHTNCIYHALILEGKYDEKF